MNVPTSCVGVCCHVAKACRMSLGSSRMSSSMIRTPSVSTANGPKRLPSFSRASARSPINLGYNYISHCTYPVHCTMYGFIHALEDSIGWTPGRTLGRLVMYVHVHERGTIDCRQVGRRGGLFVHPALRSPSQGASVSLLALWAPLPDVLCISLLFASVGYEGWACRCTVRLVPCEAVSMNMSNELNARSGRQTTPQCNEKKIAGCCCARASASHVWPAQATRLVLSAG